MISRKFLTSLKGNPMPTPATKLTKWAEINNQEKARQFHTRGIERTARADIRSICLFCKKHFQMGQPCLDVNGARCAHKSCVVSNLNELSRDGKLTKRKGVVKIDTNENTEVKRSYTNRPAKFCAPAPCQTEDIVASEASFDICLS